MNRVTVFVPQALMPAASHVCCLLGITPDLHAYQSPHWADADGRLFAVSSGFWTDAQLIGVQSPTVLNRPDLQPFLGGVIDLALCEQAQAAFRLHVGLPVGELSPDRIVAVVHDDAHAVIQSLGVIELL